MMKSQSFDSVAELLRAAGPRIDVAEERLQRVRAAVQAEWEAMVRRRQSRRRLAWIAGSIATAALVTLILQMDARPMNQNALVSSRSLGTRAALRQPANETPVSDVRFVQEQSSRRHEGARYRGTDEDRIPDGGLPRAVVVSYSWESR